MSNEHSAREHNLGQTILCTDLSHYDFVLDERKIAQSPVTPRDSSKLLVCLGKGRLGNFESDFFFEHRRFFEIDSYLNKNDLLVVNNAKVLPVRMYGYRLSTNGERKEVEVLILKKIQTHVCRYRAILRLSSKVKEGMEFFFAKGLRAINLTSHQERILNHGEVELDFICPTEFENLEAWLEENGQVPLPPYISRSDDSLQKMQDKKNYQTVYAKNTGSAAAPTAGFHFTDELLERLSKKGVQKTQVTLHVGIGTFRPIKSQNVTEHPMHEEQFEISSDFIETFLRAKHDKKRIVAVGTTVVRTLESWARLCDRQKIALGSQQSIGLFSTSEYLYPGCRFEIVDDLITNFHLPKSTLLVLVAAAMGIDGMKNAYAQALKNDYRFFSFGDAMFIRGDQSC